MLKKDEVRHGDSCFNKAHNDEMVFVLLGRDIAAPAAISAWIKERIRLGKNNVGDAQIIDAQNCMQSMLAQSRANENK